MAGSLSFNMGAKKGPKLAFGLKGQQKGSKLPALFAADSDEEEQDPSQDNKRQKTSTSEASTPSASGQPDPEQQKTADRLAEFVAKHGRSFEEVTRQRNPHGGLFKFLFDKSCPEYKYYEQRLEVHIAKQKPGFLASTPTPPAPATPSTSHQPARTPAQPRQPTHQGSRLNPPASRLNPPGPGGNSGEVPDAKKALAAGDSLAAMEAFTKLAAKRDEERGEQEARVPLLNETSFDRRRTVAVYKQDGSRGHHMQDYIPPEELAKFLAKSGSAEAKAQAEAIEASTRIQSDNIGHKLLSQMGWKEGQGLGSSGSGMAAPVSATVAMGAEKRGLGAEDAAAPQEGEDQYETYRKRMMLGYKHRPNPLGNPRKQY